MSDPGPCTQQVIYPGVTHFTELMSDKLGLFTFSYMADIFPKMNKMNLLLKGKLTTFLINDKI